jgi:glycosyltransferase involved in cell wall biosynthesis
LKEAFQDSYEVVQHNWDATYRIPASSQDVILGAPHPAPWTVFNRSVRAGGFRKAIAISPLSTDDLRNQAFVAHSVKYCDLFIALGGDYWREQHYSSVFGGLKTPTVYLDLGVDSNVFKFSELHDDGFLYIGHNHWTKNVSYLSEIASLLPNAKFGFLGSGEPIKGFQKLGRIPLHSDEAKRILEQYSYLLIASRSDANPAVILESMALGLIPICTPQCGFLEGSDRYGVFNIPLDDSKTAAKILQVANDWGEEQKSMLRIRNQKLVEANFRWDFFSRSVRLLVDDTQPNSLGSETSTLTKLTLLAGEVRSPLFPFFPEGRRTWGAPIVKPWISAKRRKKSQ